MARKQYRPGRTVSLFFVGLIVIYGLVAITGDWKPQLGLDLQGGTRITLIAQGDPSQENLDQARSIIDQRVNGSGVAEAEVTTEGGNVIAVEIPGDERRDLLATVERQAQLRFRLVANTDAAALPGDGTGLGTDPGTDTGEGTDQGDGQGTGQNQGQGQNDGQGTGQGDGNANPRPPVAFDDAGQARVPSSAPTDDPTDTPSDTPSDTPTDTPSGQATDQPTDDPSASDPATPAVAQNTCLSNPVGPNNTVEEQNGVGDADEELAFASSPTPECVTEFQKYTCDDDGTLLDESGKAANLADDPTKPLVACSPPEGDPNDAMNYRPATKFLLSKSVVPGTDINDASYQTPQNGVGYVVNIDIGGDGREAFGTVTSALAGTGDLFAIVLDSSVISSPEVNQPITNGQAQISGSFTESEADSLATSLRFGALPISFENDPSVQEIGPSLAGDQLTAGLTAGAFGLGLVLLYCLIYYRGLGTVVVASLLVAAATTYGLVLLLSSTAGFTLTLPGIAGLIIAVGITADSFIIFFERIRDEMREGKSMRVAVESGWKRAKVTRLAAQVVSLLSAAVLYIFATGVVKGFGFALGLSTLVDLAILFWFTKPMVSYLAKYKFFNGGGKLSGLSPSSLGIDGPPAATTTGGKA